MIMRNLFMDHLNDGRSAICQSILVYIGLCYRIENSWSIEEKKYLANPTVSLWNNGRERGYFISSKKGDEQLNVFFFEHRNSDEIIVKHFMGDMPPQDVYEYGDLPNDVYTDKSDYNMSYRYDEMVKAGHGIIDLFENFYELKRN